MCSTCGVQPPQNATGKQNKEGGNFVSPQSQEPTIKCVRGGFWGSSSTTTPTAGARHPPMAHFAVPGHAHPSVPWRCMLSPKPWHGPHASAARRARLRPSIAAIYLYTYELLGEGVDQIYSAMNRPDCIPPTPMANPNGGPKLAWARRNCASRGCILLKGIV